MSKKIKMAYFAVIALSIILFVVDLAIGRYNGAIIIGFSVVWLFLYYQLFKLLDEYDALCKSITETSKQVLQEYNDAMAREKIHKQEFNKMRERAQNAEKKYQELVDDTPTRDKRGRYTPRNLRKK